MHTKFAILPHRTALNRLSPHPWRRSFSSTPSRCATLIRRPKRPYTFTQLVTLTDGSSFLQRTTSPQAVLKSTKDIRNNPMWNPSSQKLLNVEEDEAGKLRAFRDRFGRGWDAENAEEDESKSDVKAESSSDDATASATTSPTPDEAAEDNLVDLISSYGETYRNPSLPTSDRDVGRTKTRGKK